MSFSACTQALVKKPMKPSLLPCFFSNTSLYCARIAMMWLMSTSLKVVSMAAVFCTSLSRRAMVWRSRVIFTRSSRAASSAGDGARTCTAAAGWLIGVGAEAAFSMAASMSPLVTRPSLPEPGTVEASTPLSADSLRTDGANGAWGGGRGRSGGRRWRRSRGCRLGRRSGGGRLGGHGTVIDLAEQRADRDGFAILGGDLSQRAGGRRRDLDGDLIGLELDQRLVHRDG